MTNPLKYGLIKRIFFIVVITTLLFLSIFIIIYLLEKNTVTTRKELIKNNEHQILEAQESLISQNFNNILEDLSFLKDSFVNQTLNHPSNDYNHLTNLWTSFIASKSIYDQVRFIDTQGKEVIRINKTPSGAISVQEHLLQNKKTCYYFQKSINLTNNTIYISPLDLNIENGDIEVPHKPMIRFATPLYINHKKVGILVINYLADEMINDFTQLISTSKGSLYLVTHAGDWYYSGAYNNDFNFMFDDLTQSSFKNTYPDVWRTINKTNQWITSDNVLATIHPLTLNQSIFVNLSKENTSLVIDNNTWYLVSIIEKNNQNKLLFMKSFANFSKAIIVKNRGLFYLSGIIIVLFTFLLYLNYQSYLKIKFHSEIDTLTGFYNRRKGIELLNQHLNQSKRFNDYLTLCYLDINGLKLVNDYLGHAVGDELITTVTQIIQKGIRESDFAIRLGGDEFLIVFKGATLKQTQKIWDRFVNEFNAINTHDKRSYTISVSHGLSMYTPNDNPSLEYLIRLADEKMYEEKKAIKKNITLIKDH